MFDPSLAGVGTHTVTYSFTDGNSCTNSASQHIAVNPVAPSTDDAFVLLAKKITLQQTKQATPGGRIHSNGAPTIEKGSPSTYKSNLTAIGKLNIYQNNLIDDDVTSPLPVANAGVLNGTLTLARVDFEALPSLSYSAGGSSHFVPSNGTLTLLPGSCHHVVLNSLSTLKLNSGDYFFTSLRDNGGTTTTAVLEIDLSSGEPITLNVVSNRSLGHEVAMRLLPNGEGDSELGTINTPQSNLTIGREAYLLGTFNAPQAKVVLEKNSQLRSTLRANEILVARDCLFLHHDWPGSLPGPGNLPKSSLEERASSDQFAVISYQLEQNYPNPFHPSTAISFQLPVADDVSLSIFNTNGRLVKQVARGNFASGRHTLVWDATDGRGERGVSVCD